MYRVTMLYAKSFKSAASFGYDMSARLQNNREATLYLIGDRWRSCVDVMHGYFYTINDYKMYELIVINLIPI